MLIQNYCSIVTDVDVVAKYLKGKIAAPVMAEVSKNE